jgi:hypothetical protein
MPDSLLLDRELETLFFYAIEYHCNNTLMSAGGAMEQPNGFWEMARTIRAIDNACIKRREDGNAKK